MVVVQPVKVGNADTMSGQVGDLPGPGLVLEVVFSTQGIVFLIKSDLVDQAQRVAGMHPGILGPPPGLVGSKPPGDVGGKAAVEGIVGTVKNVHIILTLGHRATPELLAGTGHPPH